MRLHDRVLLGVDSLKGRTPLTLLLLVLAFATTRFDDFTDLGVGVTAAGGAMDAVDGGGVHGTAVSRLDDREMRTFLLDDDDGVDVNDRRRAFDDGGGGVF